MTSVGKENIHTKCGNLSEQKIESNHAKTAVTNCKQCGETTEIFHLTDFLLFFSMSNFVGRDFGMFTLSLNRIRILFSVAYQIKLFFSEKEDDIVLLYKHRYVY